MMFQLIKIALLMGVGGVLVWVGICYPGAVDITWRAHHYHTTLTLVVCAVLGVIMVSFIMVKLFKGILGFPFRLGDQYRGYDRQRALESLATAIKAWENNDYHQALDDLKRPLAQEETRLVATYLAGQWATMATDYSSAVSYFKELKELPCGRALAFKKLMVLAQTQGQSNEALWLVQELITPQDTFLRMIDEIPSLAEEALKILWQTHRWEEMHKALDDLKGSKAVSSDLRRQWQDRLKENQAHNSAAFPSSVL